VRAEAVKRAEAVENGAPEAGLPPAEAAEPDAPGAGAEPPADASLGRAVVRAWVGITAPGRDAPEAAPAAAEAAEQAAIAAAEALPRHAAAPWGSRRYAAVSAQFAAARRAVARPAVQGTAVAPPWAVAAMPMATSPEIPHAQPAA